MYIFEGASASEVWNQAAQALCDPEKGYAKTQASRAGMTRELIHSGFIIHDPRQRWLLTRNSAISPAFAIAEITWIIAGRNDSAFVNSWNSKLPEYAGHGDTYHGAYGYRLRHHFGFDQLHQAYEVLRNDPDNREV